jgi:hypothetical protein
MIMQAAHAGLGYFQREAGYTRTGSHYARVGGQETGQWHKADLAVAHWLQDYLRWRNARARHPGVLAAQRRIAGVLFADRLSMMTNSRYPPGRAARSDFNAARA